MEIIIFVIVEGFSHNAGGIADKQKKKNWEVDKEYCRYIMS